MEKLIKLIFDQKFNDHEPMPLPLTMTVPMPPLAMALHAAPSLHAFVGLIFGCLPW
jgi:hypothetical protein